ncbi:GntR family transcriptional regulator [Streptomyces sp. NPDC101209]|uniref:GntR family transcriptional regulator n=1 Tax=Streptomyces sp. NPDC101209 TaxID=3366129 RepID=UPI003801C14F
MGSDFRIDRRGGIPAYVQIIQQVPQALRLGLLVPGDRLSTARAVVGATALNPHTVPKADRELESQGLVETRRRHGTFVTATLGASSADSPWPAELTDVAERARACGLERDDLAALFSDVLEDLYPPKEPDVISHPRRRGLRPRRPNGAGQTTLLDLAAGLQRPTCGTLRVRPGRPQRARHHPGARLRRPVLGLPGR